MQARVAERLQISRATVSKWVRRYRAKDVAGLSDQSSRPHRSPAQTVRRTERRIIALRFTRRWGPHRCRHSSLWRVLFNRRRARSHDNREVDDMQDQRDRHATQVARRRRRRPGDRRDQGILRAHPEVSGNHPAGLRARTGAGGVGRLAPRPLVNQTQAHGLAPAEGPCAAPRFPCSRRLALLPSSSLRAVLRVR